MDGSVILDRYRPLALLGEGGHGSVVLAFDTKMARRVAIKRLPLPASSADTRAQALSEARTAAMLGHPSIVTVYEWEPVESEALLVMEFVDGASLAEVLDELDGPLDLDETAAVVDAVADALSFAHANGVLHLDLKPDNVLVDRSGRVKVADFGVAALTGVDRSGRPRGGTPGYMAPEHIRGERVTPAADQWAFAALVYEMLTGVAPFDADSPQRSLVRIEARGFQPPSALAKGLPRGVDLVLEKALAPDPPDRYPDVAAFATALLDHLGDPVAGRESLADIVEDLTADEGAPGGGTAGRRRFAVSEQWLGRGAAALVSGWAGWAAASALAGHTAGAAAAGLCSLAAAFVPSLGLALALIGTAAGIGAAFGLAPGAAAGVAAALWWAGIGRRDPEAGYGLVSVPPLSSLRAAAAVPLVIGLSARPLPAAAAGASAGALAALISALSPDAPSAMAVPLGFLASPWSALDPARLAALDVRLIAAASLSWGSAALLASLAARRGSQLLTGFGIATGLALMFGAHVVFARQPAPAILPDIVAAAAIAALVAAARAPGTGR